MSLANHSSIEIDSSLRSYSAGGRNAVAEQIQSVEGINGTVSFIHYRNMRLTNSCDGLLQQGCKHSSLLNLINSIEKTSASEQTHESLVNLVSYFMNLVSKSDIEGAKYFISLIKPERVNSSALISLKRILKSHPEKCSGFTAFSAQLDDIIKRRRMSTGL